MASTITMYDDVNLALIPVDAEAVAGYVNGRWANYAEVVKRWPGAEHLSIAVTSAADADCLDVEAGDAPNSVAADWVKRQAARGVNRPVVYTSVSNARSLLGVLALAGVKRGEVRLWTAHYTGREHFCDAHCGFGMPTVADATQWTDRSHGVSLDQSVCAPNFFADKVYADRDSALRAATGYVAWRDWRVGVGAWKGRRMDRTVRPNVPNPVPIHWRLQLRLYAKFRMHRDG